MERNGEAEVFLKRALAIHKKIGKLYGSGIQDLNALAIAAQRDGDLRAAENYLHETLRLEDKLNGGKNPTAAIAMNNLADVKREEKQYGAAEQLSRKAWRQ